MYYFISSLKAVFVSLRVFVVALYELIIALFNLFLIIVGSLLVAYIVIMIIASVAMACYLAVLGHGDALDSFIAIVIVVWVALIVLFNRLDKKEEV